MGSSLSQEDKENVVGYKYFTQWRLQDVQSAWKRLQRIPEQRKRLRAAVDKRTPSGDGSDSFQARYESQGGGSGVEEAGGAHMFAESMMLNKFEFLEAFTDPTAQFEQGRPLALPLALFHPFGVLAKYKRSVSNSLDDLKREARFRFDPTLPTPSQEETDGLNGAAAGGEASSDKPMSPAGKGGPRDSGSVSGTASVGTLSPSRGHASPLLKRSVLPKAPSPNDGRKAQASTARDSDAMPETVPALQVLLMLALLCKAPTQDAQMRFCFSVFDLDGSGVIDIGELQTFFRVLTEAAFHVGILPTMPADTAYAQLAQDAFRVADADHSGEIDVEEFIAWAKGNVVSMGLLTAFKSVAPDLLVDKRHLIALRHRSKPVVAETSLPQLSRKQRLQARNKMYKASGAIIASLETDQPLDVKKVRRLRRRFIKYAGEHGRAGTLRFDGFLKVLLASFPTIANEDAQRLFDAFDTDHSGALDFEEFTIGFARHITGTTEEKIGFLFDIYDRDGDRAISVSEIQHFVLQSHGDYLEAAMLTEEILNSMGKVSGNDSIPKEQFIQALQSQPVLLEAFGKTVVPGMDSLQSSFNELALLDSDLNLKRLMEVWGRYSTNGGSETFMTRVQFRAFMRHEMGLPVGASALANRVFEVFDIYDKGRVRFKELLSGLSQVLTGSVEDRAKFYFDLYDIDGSGELDRGELMKTLLESELAAQDAEEEVETLLARLDVDNSGTVDRDEFLKACKQDGKVLECFGRIFGVQGGTKSPTKMRQVRRKFGMIKRLLNAHPSEGLSTKEQISLGQYSSMPKVEAGLREFRRLSRGTASSVIQKLQRIDTREALPRLEKRLSRMTNTHSQARGLKHGRGKKHRSRRLQPPTSPISTAHGGHVESGMSPGSPTPVRLPRTVASKASLLSSSASVNVLDTPEDLEHAIATANPASSGQPGHAGGGGGGAAAVTSGHPSQKPRKKRKRRKPRRKDSFDDLLAAGADVGVREVRQHLAAMRRKFHEERKRDLARRRGEPSKLYRPLASSHAAKAYGRSMRGVIDSKKRQLRHDMRGWVRAGAEIRGMANHSAAADAAKAAMHLSVSDTMSQHIQARRSVLAEAQAQPPRRTRRRRQRTKTTVQALRELAAAETKPRVSSGPPSIL